VTPELEGLIKATAVLSAGIFLVMRTIHSMKWLSKSRWYARLGPLLPPVLGIAGAFGGAVTFDQKPTWVVTVIYGLVAAYSSEKAHKILSQTLLGDDRRLEDGPKRKPRGAKQREPTKGKK
jgi:hypothetical protein